MVSLGGEEVNTGLPGVLHRRVVRRQRVPPHQPPQLRPVPAAVEQREVRAAPGELLDPLGVLGHAAPLLHGGLGLLAKPQRTIHIINPHFIHRTVGFSGLFQTSSC